MSENQLKQTVVFSKIGATQQKLLNRFPHMRMKTVPFFSETSIVEMPSLIEHLQGLQHLYLDDCNNLVNIPESICKLSRLKQLIVNYGTKLAKFPENLGSLQCLEALGVSDLNLSIECFTSIAANISQLSKLRVLYFSNFPKLLQVPYLPPIL